MAQAGPAISATQGDLLRDERYWALRATAKGQVLQTRGRAPAEGIIASLVQADGAGNTIRDIAYSVQQRLPGNLPATQPPNAYTGQDDSPASQMTAVLAAAHEQWQNLVLQRLHAAQLLLPTIPLSAPPRSEQELLQMRDAVADLEEPWECIGSRSSPFTSCSDAPSLSKLLYDADDVLETITTAFLPREVKVPQPGDEDEMPVKVSLTKAVEAPNRAWLQSFFADFKVDRRHMGVDDVLHPWFKEEQLYHSRHVLSAQSAAACRSAARFGVPASERPSIWACALGLKLDPTPGPTRSSSSDVASAYAAEGTGASRSGKGGNMGRVKWSQPSQRDEEALGLLCESIQRQQLLVDTLVCADVQQVVDSEHYFVFEETLRAVMLAFSRDLSISRCAVVASAPHLAAENSAGQLAHPYPPSGVLPFHGLCAYAGPVCYLYEHPAMVYRVFAAMYCRYWSALHNLSVKQAPAAGLPVLCRTFEELLQECDPLVEAHLRSLGISALTICFPWMFLAFVGYLSPPETLILWDRIIGFDSLLVLPVLAVAIVSFRRDLILAASSADELVEVMEDLSQIKVVPLLQAILFDDQ